jgi:hypothetical protein
MVPPSTVQWPQYVACRSAVRLTARPKHGCGNGPLVVNFALFHSENRAIAARASPTLTSPYRASTCGPIFVPDVADVIQIPRDFWADCDDAAGRSARQAVARGATRVRAHRPRRAARKKRFVDETIGAVPHPVPNSQAAAGTDERYPLKSKSATLFSVVRGHLVVLRLGPNLFRTTWRAPS